MNAPGSDEPVDAVQPVTLAPITFVPLTDSEVATLTGDDIDCVPVADFET